MKRLTKLDLYLCYADWVGWANFVIVWLAVHQIGYAWVASPLAVRLEELSLRWLRDLFELPAEGGGVPKRGSTRAIERKNSPSSAIAGRTKARSGTT